MFSRTVNLYLRPLHLLVKHKMFWTFGTKFSYLCTQQPSVTEHEQKDEILVWMLVLIIFNVTCNVQHLK